MFFQCRKATTNSDHNRVRLDHEHTNLRTNHILALVRLRLLLQLDDGQKCDKDDLKLCLTHNSQVIKLLYYRFLWAFALLPGNLVEDLLLFDEEVGLVDAEHLFFDNLSTGHFDVCHDLIQLFLKLIHVLFSILTSKFLLLSYHIANYTFNLVIDLFFCLGYIDSFLGFDEQFVVWWELLHLLKLCLFIWREFTDFNWRQLASIFTLPNACA